MNGLDPTIFHAQTKDVRNTSPVILRCDRCCQPATALHEVDLAHDSAWWCRHCLACLPLIKSLPEVVS